MEFMKEFRLWRSAWKRLSGMTGTAMDTKPSKYATLLCILAANDVPHLIQLLPLNLNYLKPELTEMHVTPLFAALANHSHAVVSLFLQAEKENASGTTSLVW